MHGEKAQERVRDAQSQPSCDQEVIVGCQVLLFLRREQEGAPLCTSRSHVHPVILTKLGQKLFARRCLDDCTPQLLLFWLAAIEATSPISTVTRNAQNPKVNSRSVHRCLDAWRLD